MSDDQNLSSVAARGAVFTVLTQWGRFAVQLFTIIFMARLLPPADFGIVAMVVAITTIASSLGDFGLSTAAIQAKSVSNAQRSNLFWLNLGFGMTVSAIVFLCAGLLSDLYGNTHVAPTTRAVAILFAVNAVGGQYRAFHIRDLRFRLLGWVDLLAQVAALVIGAWMAIAGAGFWSLVVQQMTFPILSTAVLILASRWLPRLPQRAPMRQFLTFGGSTMLNNVTLYACANVDQIGIGKVYGAVSTGVYQKAYQLLMLPLQQMFTPATRVALPVLSRLDGTDRFAAATVRIQLVAAYAVAFLLSGLAVVAYPLIAVTLGPTWSGAAPLFLALVAGGVFELLGYPYSWICLAKGRADVLLRQTLLARPIMVAAILVGLSISPLGTSIAVSAGFVFNWITLNGYALRAVGEDWRPLVRVSARPLFGCFIVMAVVSPLAWWHGAWDHAWLQLFVCGIAYVAVAALLTVAIPAARSDAKSLFAVARLVRERPATVGTSTPL